MRLFEGYKKIKQLSLEKQTDFVQFYQTQVQYRLLPIFCDLSLFISIVGAIFNILVLAKKEHGFENIHILNYVYLGIFIVLALAHKLSKLRYAAPLLVYFMFSTIAFFSYLNYLVVGGGIQPLYGLLFFISSLGFITLSFYHSLIIIMLNLLILTAATFLISGNRGLFPLLSEIVINLFSLLCFSLALASAVFNRWFFKNILALQYMLDQSNKNLKDTVKSLRTTENLLIQQQKHQALSHMAAGLLHEIMNPVNCATQALDYAKEINKNDEIAEALDDAIKHQTRIANLVADLRTFSSSQPQQAKQSTQFNLLVEQAIAFCHYELNSIKLNINLPNELQVACYPSSMIQVLVNLLLNSSAAFEKRVSILTSEADLEQKPYIEITYECDDSAIKIFVKDNGPGIDENDLTHLLEPFYSTSETPESLGLGLSICQTIMRHHGGHLSINSELGKGTQVVLEFPLVSNP